MCTTPSLGVYIFFFIKDLWSDTISTLSWEDIYDYSERQMEVIFN